MEYTAEQYLERIENKRLNSTPLYSREEMIDFAEKYAKQFTIHSVVLQSEQLCIKCKEAPANRGLGEHKLLCSDCWNSLCY